MSIASDRELRQEVLLVFQVALLGAVTPELRGVAVDWDENKITGVFLYDGDLTDVENEIVSDAEGEVISHFSHHTVEISAISYNNRYALNDRTLRAWVYRRYE